MHWPNIIRSTNTQINWPRMKMIQQFWSWIHIDRQSECRSLSVRPFTSGCCSCNLQPICSRWMQITESYTTNRVACRFGNRYCYIVYHSTAISRFFDNDSVIFDDAIVSSQRRSFPFQIYGRRVQQESFELYGRIRWNCGFENRLNNWWIWM